MTDRFKKIYLLTMIIGSFLIYMTYYYYNTYFKKAHYKFVEFENFEVRYTKGDLLLYDYDSKTGILKTRVTPDSISTKTIKLSPETLKSIHQKMWDLMFFDTPDHLTVADQPGTDAPRYFLEMNYQKKSKSVTWDENYPKNHYTDKIGELKKFIETRIEENQ
ncbi:hypothetical protein [Solitalea koreensis]|uniref:Uncharacterized protein n=1 Tax=Solitalea koreensis TaxID=543615 RepID=A0A521BQP9_9SPHI|nr:hypothetical protein [Solitalea koreensis]SMO49492.1 hypothetical protein SAMN06265350_102457 [Solitalea koreensis]